jgi:hypothetical protein
MDTDKNKDFDANFANDHEFFQAGELHGVGLRYFCYLPLFPRPLSRSALGVDVRC